MLKKSELNLLETNLYLFAIFLTVKPSNELASLTGISTYELNEPANIRLTVSVSYVLENLLKRPILPL